MQLFKSIALLSILASAFALDQPLPGHSNCAPSWTPKGAGTPHGLCIHDSAGVPSFRSHGNCHPKAPCTGKHPNKFCVISNDGTFAICY
ncbi:unnamed protein product [Zymoseptoria tritici ST99CH_1A5]|uniref:Uncharacterized protein n=2 Tax=Zymoseptoria tritici TaxID=1047171 RepID=A0A1X7RT40_ZYMT9|nr:unnamed protein product [Zymoseptoria tritici ST99CH_3D7]SMY24236.1 unnamed protein product [Zymoseptoria tritici ST99CH_1A5]